MGTRMFRTSIIGLAVISGLLFTGQSCINLSSNKTSDGGVYRSDDRGTNWTQKVFVGQVKKKLVTIAGNDIGAMEFLPSNPSTIYLGTTANGLYRTDDGGERWQLTGRRTGSITVIAAEPVSSQTIYVGNGGHIDRSIDGGTTWARVYTETRTGITISAIGIDPTNTKHVFAGNTGGVLIETKDYAATWQVRATLNDGIKQLILDPRTPKLLFASLVKSGLVRSQDGGSTWSYLSEKMREFPGSSAINDIALDLKSPATIYLGTTYGLMKSKDLGESWSAPTTLIPNQTAPIQQVAVDPSDSSKVYFTVTNKVHLTNDAGATWTVSTVPTKRQINELKISPKTPSTLYVGVYQLKKK